MLNYEQTVVSDWVRDDLPDLLWPLILASSFGDRAGRMMGDVQRAVLESVPGEALDQAGAPVDGRLTSLERTPEDMRPAFLDVLRELGPQAVPDALVGISHLYSAVPGAWFTGFRKVEIQPDEAAETLGRAIFSAVTDTSVNAMVKFPQLGWRVLRQTVSVESSTVELLRDYPINPSTRSPAEAIILSLFLAMKGADYAQHPEHEADTIEWAHSFWNQGWALSPCLVQSAVLPDELDPPDPSDAAPSMQAREAAVSAYEDFIGHAMRRSLELDLYDPARHEVLTALATRAFRAVHSILGHRDLWTGEHASNTMRLLFETKVVILWLVGPGKPAGFARFQSYGRGKQKLLWRHVKELEKRFDDDAPSIVQALSGWLEDKVGGEWGDAFQEVDLSSNFAGITLRQMADEVGELDAYNHVFASTSAVLHGEWWAVEDYVMQRCGNPLHRFHWVPCLEEPRPEDQFPELLQSWLQDVLDIARDGLRDP
jgi:hypothetical protein